MQTTLLMLLSFILGCAVTYTIYKQTISGKEPIRTNVHLEDDGCITEIKLRKEVNSHIQEFLAIQQFADVSKVKRITGSRLQVSDGEICWSDPKILYEAKW